MAARFGLPQPWLSIGLFVVWQFLSDGISGASIVMGLILGIGIPLITYDFWPEHPRMRRPMALVRFVLVVLYDIVVASVIVAMVILRPRPPRSAFIHYPLEITDPLGITILANAISLTPGTVIADVDDRNTVLLIHALDVDDDEELIGFIKRRYEEPLLEMFQ